VITARGRELLASVTKREAMLQPVVGGHVWAKKRGVGQLSLQGRLPQGRKFSFGPVKEGEGSGYGIRGEKEVR